MSDPIYEILDNLRKEVQSLRVENDRLRRSRNDEVAAAGELRKEIERLRSRVAELERTLTRTSANLMAAISLLKAGGRDAAPSDKMFRQMLNDYEKAAQDGREKLLEDKL